MMQDAPKASGLFVAVGHDGLRMTSTDGSTWLNVKTGKEGEVYRAVCFGGGRFAAVGSYGGSNIFAGSRDGVSWELKTLDAKYSKYLRGVGYGRGEFIAVGGDPGSVGSSSPLLVRSSDGVNWSDYIAFSGKNILRRIAFGDGRFVGVGDRGRRATSTDGLTWVDYAGGEGDRYLGGRRIWWRSVRRRGLARAADEHSRRPEMGPSPGRRGGRAPQLGRLDRRPLRRRRRGGDL